MSEYRASMAITPSRSKAVRELIDVGLIPAECTHFELILDRHEAIQARCTFWVNEEQMQQIADAFKRNPEEAAQVLRTAKAIIFPMKDDAVDLPPISF